MKKISILLLILIVTISIVGCQKSEQKPSEYSQQSESESDSKQPESDSKQPETSSDTTVEDKKTENVDFSKAIDATTTTETEPVGLNQWAKTTRYATQDKTHHTVYVRVTKVTTSTSDPEYIKDVIKQHNSNCSDYKKIDTETLKIPSDTELCILDYEVFVPNDFPSAEYGLAPPDIHFSAENIGGGGIPSADGASTYIGMGSMENLTTEKDPKYQAGNTYSFKNMFIMVKGYDKYVFGSTAYPYGTIETSSDIKYQTFYAAK